MSGKKHLRYYSEINGWMDCIITVNENDADKARETVRNAVNSWFEDDAGLCYGDAIESALEEAGIEYGIRYHDSNVDETSAEWEKYEKRWESSLPEDWEPIDL